MAEETQMEEGQAVESPEAVDEANDASADEAEETSTEETPSAETAVAAATVDEDENDEDVDADVDDEDIPAAYDDDDDDEDIDDDDDDDDDSVSFTDGPANFARTKEGRRRNPRHVGNEVKMDEISYKNVQILSRFVDNRGRIYSRRKTRVSAKMQRKVTRAIKRARHLALMPYTGEHVRITRKGSR